MTEPTPSLAETAEFSAQRALFAALAKAVEACEWVKKEAQGQGYKYASCVVVVKEADRVLTDNGISIIPGPCIVTPVGKPKETDRTVFILTREFTVVHRDGGWIKGGGVAAIGANVGSTPPQATNSAETMCFAYFCKTLLRMPRQDEEDADHESQRQPLREEEPRPPARPAVPVRSTGGLDAKLPMILESIARIATVEQYERALSGFTRATETRGMPVGDGETDMCGYTDAGFAQAKAALAKAADKVGAR